jgi:hypothetical protein
MSLEYLRKGYLAIINDLNFEWKKVNSITPLITQIDENIRIVLRKSLNRGRVKFVKWIPIVFWLMFKSIYANIVYCILRWIRSTIRYELKATFC